VDPISNRAKAEAAATAMLASAGITPEGMLPPTSTTGTTPTPAPTSTTAAAGSRPGVPPPPPPRQPKKERKDLVTRGLIILSLCRHPAPRSPLHVYILCIGMSDEVATSVSSSLLSMASDKDSRGAMVQQGVLPMLVNLSEHPNDKCQVMCSTIHPSHCIPLCVR
jgi:hypothetical protein